MPPKKKITKCTRTPPHSNRSRESAHKDMQYNKWKEEDLVAALAARKADPSISYAKLEKRFGVPASTIYKRVTGLVKGTAKASGGSRKRKAGGMQTPLISFCLC